METEKQEVSESKYPTLMRKLRKELTYTELPKAAVQDIKTKCTPRKYMTPRKWIEDPTMFMYHILGIKPYQYQYHALEWIRTGRKRIALCLGRRAE